MKEYVVTYRPIGGLFYHFRCYANNKREARKECLDYFGGRKYIEIIDCFEEQAYRRLV